MPTMPKGSNGLKTLFNQRPWRAALFCSLLSLVTFVSPDKAKGEHEILDLSGDSDSQIAIPNDPVLQSLDAFAVELAIMPNSLKPGILMMKTDSWNRDGFYLEVDRRGRLAFSVSQDQHLIDDLWITSTVDTDSLDAIDLSAGPRAQIGVKHDPAMDNMTSFTVEAELRFTKLTDQGFLLKTRNWKTEGFFLAVEAGRLVFGLGNEGEEQDPLQVVSRRALEEDRWYRVRATKRGDIATLTIDGEAEGEVRVPTDLGASSAGLFVHAGNELGLQVGHLELTRLGATGGDDQRIFSLPIDEGQGAKLYDAFGHEREGILLVKQATLTSPPGILSEGHWQDLALEHSNGRSRMLVDGKVVADGQMPDVVVDNTAPLMLGARQASADVQVKNFSFWNLPSTAAEHANGRLDVEESSVKLLAALEFVDGRGTLMRKRDLPSTRPDSLAGKPAEAPTFDIAVEKPIEARSNRAEANVRQTPKRRPGDLIPATESAPARPTRGAGDIATLHGEPYSQPTPSKEEAGIALKALVSSLNVPAAPDGKVEPKADAATHAQAQSDQRPAIQQAPAPVPAADPKKETPVLAADPSQSRDDGGAGLVRAPLNAQYDVKLVPGKGELVRVERPAADVVVADPNIANVRILAPELIYLFGNGRGSTDVFVLDSSQTVLAKVQVEVVPDAERAAQELAAAQPETSVAVDAALGGLVTDGVVTDPAEARDVASLAANLATPDLPVENNTSITGSQQVNIRVRFAEVSRNDVFRLGLNWRAIFESSDFLFGLSSGNLFSPTTGSGDVATPFGNLVQGGIDRGDFDVDLLLDGLQQEGVIRVLAEPNLTAVNGEDASFLAGGEVPIPVPEGDEGVGFEFKQFGVSLDFTPTILPGERINLRVRPEVSELVTAGGVFVEGFAIPAFSVRRTDTSVELASGQTFAIAGLFQRNISDTVDQFPGLGQLPILGALFTSQRYQRSETELVILITPYLVEPTGRRDVAVPGRLPEKQSIQASHLPSPPKPPGPASFILN